MPTPIPAGAVALDRMGAERPVALTQEVGPFATVAVDVGACAAGSALAGADRGARRAARGAAALRGDARRIACASRMSMSSAAICSPIRRSRACRRSLGRGYLLPFPVLPRERFRSIVQPTPMAVAQTTLPMRLDVFDEAGNKVAERFLGCLPRDHDVALEVDDVAAGHAELVYDFRDGGEADGWLHALFRYEDRQSGHAAESSFGAHIFNTIMTYRDEPQSYGGPPPGLTTRLFLKLGDARRRSFAVLIYPASAPWHAQSATMLLLHDGAGEVIAEAARGDRVFRLGDGVAARGVRRGGAAAGGTGWLRAGARHDVPAVRLPRADGRRRRLLAGPYVRVLKFSHCSKLRGGILLIRSPGRCAYVAVATAEAGGRNTRCRATICTHGRRHDDKTCRARGVARDALPP